MIQETRITLVNRHDIPSVHKVIGSIYQTPEGCVVYDHLQLTASIYLGWQLLPNYAHVAIQKGTKLYDAYVVALSTGLGCRSTIPCFDLYFTQRLIQQVSHVHRKSNAKYRTWVINFLQDYVPENNSQYTQESVYHIDDVTTLCYNLTEQLYHLIYEGITYRYTNQSELAKIGVIIIENN